MLAAVALVACPVEAVPMVAGLELWLDANQGVNETAGAINSWTDQAGGNVFAPHSAAKPTLVAGGLNGMPVVSFSGSALKTATADLGDQKTVFVVIAPDSLPAGQGQRFFGNYGRGQLRYNTGKASGYFGFNADQADTRGIAAGKFATLAYRFDDNVLIGINGRAPTPGSSSNPLFDTGSSLAVGGVGDGGGTFGGDIAEVLVYDHALSNTDRSTVEVYLREKWFPTPGIGPSPYTPDAHTAALYHLDETSGNTVFDASGNGLDLSSNAAPLNAVAGPKRLAYAAGAFAAGANQLARTPTASEVANFDTNHFTIEAWVRNPELNADHDGVFTYRSSSSRFQFGVVGTNGRLALGIQRDDTGGWHNMQSGGLAWEDDMWYHIAVTYDSNTAALNDSTVNFYQTALSDTSSIAQLIGQLLNQPDLEPLTAGGILRLGGFDGMTSRVFGGDIDEVRYSNIVRSNFNVNLLPEPASLVLVGGGLLALLRRRRTR